MRFEHDDEYISFLEAVVWTLIRTEGRHMRPIEFEETGERADPYAVEQEILEHREQRRQECRKYMPEEALPPITPRYKSAQ